MALVALLDDWHAAASLTARLPPGSPEWLEAIAVARERRARYDERLDSLLRAQRADRQHRPRPWVR
jgi:hypothetical protein